MNDGQVWVVTFHDDDGRGGTNSYVVGVFVTEEAARTYMAGRSYPPDWYSVDAFEVQA